MKLVQLLAKELSEWPDNNLAEFSALFVAQDDDGMIVTLDPEEKPDADQFNGCSWSRHSWTGGDLIFEVAEDHATSIITRDQWQAEREKMNKPKWIRHRGGNTTLHPGTMIEARLRSGEIQRAIAGEFLWDNSLSDHAVNIMAYRVIEETKDQEIEKVKDTNIGTITYKLEIDATEATKEIDSLVAKWGQIESPLKWRDEIIELEAYEEEFRREREKLIRKLESEGFKLIGHAPAKCLLDEWEAMDYESFCVGDTVVCIHEKPDDTAAELTIGKEYRLILDDEQLCVIDDAGDTMRYCIEIGCFKLVKRA